MTTPTTPLYWDCECPTNWIHPKTEFSCIFCGATQEEATDSRIEEVNRFLGLDIKE
jgi:hypothetical protein